MGAEWSTFFLSSFKYRLAMANVCESPAETRENKHVSFSQSKVNQCAAWVSFLAVHNEVQLAGNMWDVVGLILYLPLAGLVLWLEKLSHPVSLPPPASKSSLRYSVLEDGCSSTVFVAVPKPLHEQNRKTKTLLDAVTFTSVVSSEKRLLMAAWNCLQ